MGSFWGRARLGKLYELVKQLGRKSRIGTESMTRNASVP